MKRVKKFSDLIGEVILDKYKILCLLERGAFGQVFICENINSKKKYAMKIPFSGKYDPKNKDNKHWKYLAEFTFQREAFILQQFLKYETKWSLRFHGFPVVHDVLTLDLNKLTPSPIKSTTNIEKVGEMLNEVETYTSKLENNVSIEKTLPRMVSIVVLDLLGPTLSDIVWYLRNTENTKSPLSEVEVYSIGIQILDSLQFIHSHGLVHCDIKPSNILCGGKLWRKIYLVDFGMSENYISREGKHVEFGKGKGFLGTALYCGKSALMGNMPSRKDDIESLGFVLYFLLTSELGWKKYCDLMREAKSSEEKEKLRVKVFELKKEFLDFLESKYRLKNKNKSTDQKTKKKNKKRRRIRKYKYDPLIRYFRMVRSLRYDEEPDYTCLRGLFEDFVLESCDEDKNKAKVQKFKFCWSNKKDVNCFEKFKIHGRGRELDSSSVLFGEQLELPKSIPFFVV